MTNESLSRLKVDLAVARSLLDEVERTASPDGRVVAQLVEELGRVTRHLSAHLDPPSSGARLSDVA